MYNKYINKAGDLVTTHEQTRAGFLNIALEKNRVGDPYIKNALAFKSMVSDTKTPEDFLKMQEVRPFLLTASGLSEKSMKYLNEEDQTAAIQELIEKFLKIAGDNYIEETIYRYLLIKGETMGGIMRNRIGALGQEKLIRYILSGMNVQGIKYSWMENIFGVFPWNEMTDEDYDIERKVKALYWKSEKGDRVLGFNLKIPIVKKNVDLCLFDCNIEEYDKGKIVNYPEKILMLGELKGGIDPNGADEHWKTANTALERIRISFKTSNLEVKTSFIGAAIEKAMADEIYYQLENGIMTNAANLTDSNQLVEFCNWIIHI